MAFARAVNISGSSQALRPSAGMYRGFTMRETSGTTAAVVRLWDSASAASGNLVETISLSAKESTSDFLGGGSGSDEGVILTAGLYVEIVSGSVEGSVRFG